MMLECTVQFQLYYLPALRLKQFNCSMTQFPKSQVDAAKAEAANAQRCLEEGCTCYNVNNLTYNIISQ